MGRSIYFTEQEILQLIHYVNEAMDILSDGTETCERVNRDMKDGLESALGKLYKGKEGEKLFSNKNKKQEGKQ